MALDHCIDLHEQQREHILARREAMMRQRASRASVRRVAHVEHELKSAAHEAEPRAFVRSVPTANVERRPSTSPTAFASNRELYARARARPNP